LSDPRSITLSPQADRLLARRYLRRDDSGRVTEGVLDLFARVAEEVAEAERNYGSGSNPSPWAARFNGLMADLEFLPNSPTLMNAGRSLGQLSACFVLPIEDDLSSIFESVKQAALIQQSGGGTGFSFSHLRPAGDVVRSTKGVSSGPLSFMGVFDAATDTIRQGGTRRGANMGVLRVDHPDIEAFIRSKEDCQGLTNFNISVAVTDAFMRARQEGGSYDLINPRTGRTAGSRPAGEIFGMMAEAAWRCGDPGVLFIDAVNRANPTPDLGSFESTNPCGEQPLLPYESCNLGSINLARMVRGDALDEDRLARVARDAVRFLDDVIDVNRYPLENIWRATLQTRKVGLGVMGWADCLMKMGIPYGDERAAELAARAAGIISRAAVESSRELAEARGAFPAFKGSIYDRRGETPRRNATVTTIAPTGSISLIAGCSSGIEPLFGLSFSRRVLDGEVFRETNPLVLETLAQRGLLTEDVRDHIIRHGRLTGLDHLPDDVRRLFATADELPPQVHLNMQAAWQSGVENAVSKTVNLPAEAGRDQVARIFEMAWEMGLKGVTVFRQGSRGEQVIVTGEGSCCSRPGGC
jgi:ribonucleoside-diphosphate reductase alpha chain